MTTRSPREPMSGWRQAAQIFRYLTVGAAQSILRNWTLAGLALILSLSLWVFVSEAENPTRTDFFPGVIPIEIVNVPPNLAVSSVSETLVSVRISAPENVFDRLSVDDFHARVDLSSATAREVRVPVIVTTDNRRVEIIEPSPREVTLTLEPVTSRTVPVDVDLVGAPPVGFEVGDVSPALTEVRASGPETLVNQLRSACAEVNLATGVKVSFTQTVILKGKNVRCGDIQGLTFEPGDVTVDVELRQVIFSSGFIVAPVVRGTPAEGFRIASVLADPAIVRISGPVDVLQSINAIAGIPTEDVSVDGATAGVITQRVGLRVPPGAQVQGASQVTVRVTIAAITGERPFEVVPEVRNARAGLRSTLATPVVRLVLQGEVNTLNALSPADIPVFVDAAGLEAGLHLLEVRVQPPAGTSIISIDPPLIGVALSP
ncbi:MAG TPA: CdaR family protein [Dehalococcoidia bacterium]|nr:CdaR family protein [Dehalococcoidia bacterium]